MEETIEGELIEVESQPESQRGKPKGIDKKKVEKLLKAGMSQVDVAEAMGVTKQTINYHAKQFDILPSLDEYKSNKADILESKQAEVLLHGLTRDKIKGANAQQSAVIFGILDDKIRLERGQATSILDVDIRALVASISTRTDTEMVTE